MGSQKGKVLVAMSGGVDSSVAAAILVREGYEVVGCFMRLGSPGEAVGELTPYEEQCDASRVKIGHQGCCSIADAADARLVAAKLGTPFYVCNFKREFGRIIDYFVDEYANGRTPNPCVRCNDWLKFGKLHEYAEQIGAKFVASGHYARVENGNGGVRLLRGVDHAKDQSYVLFGTPAEKLGGMMLPIGGMEKSAVREMARELGLPVFDKPDSQEICFVPDNDYAGLVERRREGMAETGAILDERGEQIGEHRGQHKFTIGQRRGVGVAVGLPLYVIEKDVRANTITVGPKERLAAGGCIAREVNWLGDAGDAGEWRKCSAKIRYNAAPVEAACRVDVEGDKLDVRFAEAQYAVAPGQAVVCYEGDVVLGGGWIEKARESGEPV